VTAFMYDLAISAVPYDAALVTELFAKLAPRLRTEPVWEGHAEVERSDARPTLVADQSRLALVLHQRLWPHDDATKADASLLRQRLTDRPKSVCLMTLDDTPVPSWLSKVRRCDLTATGLEGAADFALDAIASWGGAVSGAPTPDAAPAPATRWPEGPPPFLGQPRAQSALRRELDAIAAELKARVDLRQAGQAERTCELHTLPHRLVARFDDVGISFSWVAGRLPTVGDGRLLVIEWSGVAPQMRGIGALTAATPVREKVYRADATGPEAWRWRLEGPHGRAYSTANLVAEWVAGASLERMS